MMHVTAYRQRPRHQAQKWYKLILLGTFLMFVYVSVQVVIVYLEQSIYRTDTETAQLTQDVSRLKINVSDLSKSSRIKRIAMEQLGLKVPEGLPRTLF
jgi:cell division protein FtsL